MPISCLDWEFMKKVSDYYKTTDGSIRETAVKFDISRNKVRKILITTGDITSPITEKVMQLRAQGMPVETIAEKLGVSAATVSVYMPYEDMIKDTLEPTAHTQAVRDYRAYEKTQAERQVQKRIEEDKGERQMDTTWKDEWKKDIKISYTETDTRPARMTWDDADRIRESGEFDDVKDMFAEIEEMRAQKEREQETELEELKGIENPSIEQQKRLDELKEELGLYDGALTRRRIKDLEIVSGERVPFEPRDVYRLHLELDDYLDDDERDVLWKHGNMKYGEHISRDVIVPADIPLYAIHYLIQRLFGWQNSHLHDFRLPEDKFSEVTGNTVGTWCQLVGILFRSPFMSDDAEFWADDYEGGSFKNWLTKKYTGPYISQCYEEGIMSCLGDMQNVFKAVVNEELFYVLYVKYSGDDEHVVAAKPVYDENGIKNDPPTADWIDGGEKRVEVVKLGDVPVRALRFERSSFDLLERLPLYSVLSTDPIEGGEMLDMIQKYIDRIIENGVDSPSVQVIPIAITDTLFYNYDFGDGWTVKISIMDDCRDLVEQKRINQEQFDKAQIKCRELYRPVTIATDGEMLLDDVGGMHGFVEFLSTIHPDYSTMTSTEKSAAKAEKDDMLAWAKSQNWKKLSPMI